MRRLKVTNNSPAILGFTFICFAALILGFMTGNLSTELLFSVYRAPLSSPFTWLRFFTHMFGHIGWEHLMGNMMIILITGPLLEEKYGTKNIIVIMMGTAFITGLFHFIFFPNTMLLGASGVAFAFILLSSLTGIKEGELPMTFILVAVIYIGQQVYEGLFSNDNVSNLTHIIGGLTGSAFGYLINKESSG